MESQKHSHRPLEQDTQFSGGEHELNQNESWHTPEKIDPDRIKDSDIILDLLPTKTNGEAWTFDDLENLIPTKEMVSDPETGQEREMMIFDPREGAEAEEPITEAIIYQLSFSSEIDEYAMRILALSEHLEVPIILTTPPGRGESDQLTREQIADMADGNLDEFAKSEWRTIYNNPKLENLQDVHLIGFSEGGTKAAALAANAAEFSYVHDKVLTTREDGEEFFVDQISPNPDAPKPNLKSYIGISFPGGEKRNHVELLHDTVSSSRGIYDTDAEAYAREGWRRQRAAESISKLELFKNLPDASKTALMGLAWASRRIRSALIDVTDPLYANTLAPDKVTSYLVKARNNEPELKISLATSTEDKVGKPEAIKSVHDRLEEEFGNENLLYSLESRSIPEAPIDSEQEPNHSRMQSAENMIAIVSREWNETQRPTILR